MSYKKGGSNPHLQHGQHCRKLTLSPLLLLLVALGLL